MVVAGSADHLEPDVPEGVENHNAGALEPDPMGGVPARVVLHAVGKFALKKWILRTFFMLDWRKKGILVLNAKPSYVSVPKRPYVILR